MAGLIVPVDAFLREVVQVTALLVPISAFFLSAPVFGNAMVPARVKVGMALAVALAIRGTVAPLSSSLDSALDGLILEVAWQTVASLGLGLATLTFFQIFVIAGQFVGMQMGLGFASMVDPGNGVQVTVWSQFYLMLATLCFLGVDGHLLTLEVLIQGLKLAPTLAHIDGAEFFWRVISLGGWMFAGGASVALPVVFALLVVNLAFGVMSRSAPQLNVFSLGFPFSLLFGLVLVWLSLRGWLAVFERERLTLAEHLQQLFS
ncbi:MAG: flagellar biosynthetic protein FliR [Pseudomonadota bacterium]